MQIPLVIGGRPLNGALFCAGRVDREAVESLRTLVGVPTPTRAAS
jgi:hypothetical protein